MSDNPYQAPPTDRLPPPRPAGHASTGRSRIAKKPRRLLTTTRLVLPALWASVVPLLAGAALTLASLPVLGIAAVPVVFASLLAVMPTLSGGALLARRTIGDLGLADADGHAVAVLFEPSMYVFDDLGRVTLGDDLLSYRGDGVDLDLRRGDVAALVAGRPDSSTALLKRSPMLRFREPIDGFRALTFKVGSGWTAIGGYLAARALEADLRRWLDEPTR